MNTALKEDSMPAAQDTEQLLFMICQKVLIEFFKRYEDEQDRPALREKCRKALLTGVLPRLKDGNVVALAWIERNKERLYQWRGRILVGDREYTPTDGGTIEVSHRMVALPDLGLIRPKAPHAELEHSFSWLLFPASIPCAGDDHKPVNCPMCRDTGKIEAIFAGKDLKGISEVEEEIEQEKARTAAKRAH